MLARAADIDLSGTPWRRLNLSITRDIWCLVDAADYEWIVAHNWNYGWHAKTRWKYYAKRNIGPGRSTVYLHREILLRADPQDEAFVAAHHGDHINGQSLDNRRANLRWLSPQANNANRRARQDIPSLASIIAGLLREQPAAVLDDVPF